MRYSYAFGRIIGAKMKTNASPEIRLVSLFVRPYANTLLMWWSWGNILYHFYYFPSLKSRHQAINWQFLWEVKYIPKSAFRVFQEPSKLDFHPGVFADAPVCYGTALIIPTMWYFINLNEEKGFRNLLSYKRLAEKYIMFPLYPSNKSKKRYWCGNRIARNCWHFL